MPTFVKGIQQRFFIDVYLSQPQTIRWTAKASADWISLSQSSGVLKAEMHNNATRLWVAIDWNKCLKTERLSGEIVFSGVGKEIFVKLDVIQPKELETYKGFVECNGQVSIFANRYTKVFSTNANGWKMNEGLGYTGTALESFVAANATVDTSLAAQAGHLVYEFYSFSNAAPNISLFTLPTHPLNKNYSMRYAVRIDDGALKIVDFKTTGRSEEWKQNVLRNNAVKTVSFPAVKPGKHTLKIYAIDPGVILDRILINFSATQKAYGVVPQTWKE